MTVFLSRWEGRMSLLARPEGPGIVGTAQWDIEPGSIVLGKSYKEWAALPNGAYEIHPVSDSTVSVFNYLNAKPPESDSH